MKKGILKQRGDLFEIEYQKSALKKSTLRLPGGFEGIDSSLVDKEVEFEMDNSGKVIKVIGGKTSLSIKTDPVENLKSKSDYINIKEIKEKEIKKDCVIKKTNLFARSPYNFVPLNKHVFFNGESINFDNYKADRFTGYIDIRVNNLTPLFLRQISESENNFGYGGQFGIPGSSFRGMIRTMCEILSFSKFSFYNERYPYFRGQLLSMERIQSGVIKYDKSSKEFKVYKCNYDIENTERWQEESIVPPRNESNRIVFTTGQFGKKVDGNYKSGYNKFEFFNIEATPSYSISKDSDIYKDYVDDKNGKKNPNIFDEKREEQYPIFYQLTNDNNLKTIGSAKFHRIPYTKNVKGHLPSIHHLSDVDIIESLFGTIKDDNNTAIASRLSFGDILSSNSQYLDNKSYLLKILSSPKSTTFQHYLEQKVNGKVCDWDADNDIRGYKMYWHRKTQNRLLAENTQFDNLLINYRKDNTADITWNEPWNKDKDDYNFKQNGKLKTGSHTLRIKPIQEGATFNGKIWFNNLSKLELGLVLTALEPSFDLKGNEKVAHKMGLGKPLGLGSIQISVDSVNVLDLKENNYFKAYDQKPSSVDKSDFSNYYKEELAKKLNITDIWAHDRLLQLKTMLTWDDEIVGTDDWLKKTRYMEITRGELKEGKRVTRRGQNEFKDKPILPKPSETISKNDNQLINKNP